MNWTLKRQTFAVTQAELNVKVKKTEIDVLKNFTKAMRAGNAQRQLEGNQGKTRSEQGAGQTVGGTTRPV